MLDGKLIRKLDGEIIEITMREGRFASDIFYSLHFIQRALILDEYSHDAHGVKTGLSQEEYNKASALFEGLGDVLLIDLDWQKALEIVSKIVTITSKIHDDQIKKVLGRLKEDIGYMCDKQKRETRST